MDERRHAANARGSVLVLALAWLATVGLACLRYATSAPTGEGFTRGWNRVVAFLGWQLAALVPALVAAALVLRHREALEPRWRALGLAPLAIEVAFAALLGVLVAWARFA